jgi:lipopolysaccharide biosynthesis glycosyltransferase
MTDTRVTVVLAADDRFSRPLAVTVRSIVSQLSPGRALDMYVCDMGMTAENRAMVQSVADHAQVSFEWVSSLTKEVEQLPAVIKHISRAAYGRLFIPWALPRDLEKVLYIDCDLIARRCIGDLFAVPVDDFAAMGVADAGSPFVSSLFGVPFWARYGRRADDVNFNSGVLLMNLPAWRKEDLTGAAIKYLTDGRHRFLADQEAINAVLPGRIGHLDPRWNQQTEHFEERYQATQPYDEDELRVLLADPWIVHFTTAVKPWHYESNHPFRAEWFRNLDETPYRGWRPKRSQYMAGQAGKLTQRVRQQLAPPRSS